MNVLRPVIWAEDNLGLFLRCEGNPRLATPILGALTNTFSGNPLVMGGGYSPTGWVRSPVSFHSCPTGLVRTAEFDFTLPLELIAQSPADARDRKSVV